MRVRMMILALSMLFGQFSRAETVHLAAGDDAVAIVGKLLATLRLERIYHDGTLRIIGKPEPIVFVLPAGLDTAAQDALHAQLLPILRGEKVGAAAAVDFRDNPTSVKITREVHPAFRHRPAPTFYDDPYVLVRTRSSTGQVSIAREPSPTALDRFETLVSKTTPGGIAPDRLPYFKFTWDAGQNVVANVTRNISVLNARGLLTDASYVDLLGDDQDVASAVHGVVHAAFKWALDSWSDDPHLRHQAGDLAEHGRGGLRRA